MKQWKVGELAKRTGLTVRTLHHYDAVGLLSPAGRTRAGYRLYTEAEVQRLQQIVSMRELGLSLEEIGDTLDAGETSPLEVVERHLRLLDERIEAQRRLRARLQRVLAAIRSAGTVSAEELLQTIEEITMFEKYYTPEQLAQLERRREDVGPERIEQVQAEWPELIAQVRAEMERGTDPVDPRMQELARRWQGLVDEFTGGDPDIARSLGNLYREEGEQLQASHGSAVPDPALFDYIGRAMRSGAGPE